MGQLYSFGITRGAGGVAEKWTVVRCAFIECLCSLRRLTLLYDLFEAVEFDLYSFTGCELSCCRLVEGNQKLNRMSETFFLHRDDLLDIFWCCKNA